MAQPIRMPKPGQMTEECVLVAWHKREGDEIRRGDVLFEIETDKSIMDVEAFDDGVLLKRVVEDGATVPVNAVCGYIGAPGEAIAAEPAADAAAGRKPPAVEIPVPAVGARNGGMPAEAHQVVPEAVSAAVAAPGVDRSRFAISPRAARLAAESGIDPGALRGSGPGGRVVERDVRTALGAGLGAGSTRPSPAALPAAAADEGEAPPVPLSRMRRVIAERLTSSAAIPTFDLTVAVDASAVLDLRAELKAAGTALSITDFVLAATARTLAEFSDVNSRTDGSSVWVRRRVHLGLAVALPDGLVVPVIRDADRLTLRALHDEAVALAADARRGRLAPDQMTDGTFTVSNLGMHGVEEFRAIINPGESAILAVSSLLPTAVAIGDGLAVRQVMRLTLTADHRLVDGERGARFMNRLRQRLEDADAFRAQLAAM